MHMLGDDAEDIQYDPMAASMQETLFFVYMSYHAEKHGHWDNGE